MGVVFDYVVEVVIIDVDVLMWDIEEVMIILQLWWFVDYGYYGLLFIWMVWYVVGIYCIYDGCGGVGGGMQWFVLFNSWFDNVSLDKVCWLLWLVKKKYGKKFLWVDLIVFVGNCVLELMGFKMFGFGFGWVDQWEFDEVYWGKEVIWFGDECYSGKWDLENLLVVVQMGLIYVNLEGLNGNLDFMVVVVDICEMFWCMVMNDVEIVVLIVGGYIFGKIYGVGLVDLVGFEFEVVLLEQMGLGWKSLYGIGIGKDVIISGIEVVWMNILMKWDNSFFEILYGYEWELMKSFVGVW